MSHIKIEKIDLLTDKDKTRVINKFRTKRVFNTLCHDMVNSEYIIDSIMNKSNYIYIAKRSKIIVGFATIIEYNKYWYIDVICVGRQHSMKRRTMLNSSQVKGTKLLDKIKNDVQNLKNFLHLSSLEHVYGYYKKQGFKPINPRTHREIKYPRPKNKPLTSLTGALKSKQNSVNIATNNGFRMSFKATPTRKTMKGSKNRNKTSKGY